MASTFEMMFPTEYANTVGESQADYFMNLPLPLMARAYLADVAGQMGSKRGLFQSDFSDAQIEALRNEVIDSLFRTQPVPEDKMMTGMVDKGKDYKDYYEDYNSGLDILLGMMTNEPMVNVRNTVGGFPYLITPSGDAYVEDPGYNWSTQYYDPNLTMNMLNRLGKFAHTYGGTRQALPGETETALPYTLYLGNIYGNRTLEYNPERDGPINKGLERLPLPTPWDIDERIPLISP